MHNKSLSLFIHLQTPSAILDVSDGVGGEYLLLVLISWNFFLISSDSQKLLNVTRYDNSVEKSQYHKLWATEQKPKILSLL